jgi:EmrB/QacA subfamily drug resistance transporter
MNLDTASIKLDSLAASEQTGEPSKGFKKWIPLIVLSLALTIIILDTTILNVSLRTIIDDLHTNIQNMQWVITAYSLMLAAFTITGGRLGDLFGRKKMFVVGAIIFAVGSFITSISHSVGLMIAGEAIIEGIGACLMLPATASLLVSNYTGRDRQIGFGIWGGIAAGAAALGPVVGGWLTTYYSWRWAFRINVFVAAVLVLASFLIKEVKDREEKPTIDFMGILLSALGLLSIVFAFIKASTYGWWHAAAPFTLFGQTINLGGLSVTPVFMLLGIIILALFAWWEDHVQKQCETPLVSLKLFSNSQFILAASITAILSLGQAGLSFAIPVFLQGVKNLDPLHTGFAMLPMTLTLLIAAPLSAYISKFISPKRIIQIGLLLDILAFLALRAGVSVTAGIWALAPGFALFGAGAGLMMSQSSNMALSAVSVEESGAASGVNTTLRQVGATLGSAIMGAILISTLSAGLVSGVNASTAIPTAMKPALSKTVSQQASGIEFGTGINTGGGTLPTYITNAITGISNQATVDGNKKTFAYAIGFIIFALLLSFWLPASGNLETNKSLATNQEVEMISRQIARRRGFVFAALLAIIVGVISYNAGVKKEEKVLAQAPSAQSATNSAVPAEALQTIFVRGPDPVATSTIGQ